MANQHFFKPLLPGFHSHLTIPVAFFLKNIEGRYKQKMAELRSDASKITWKVKIDGQRLTDGWKEFAIAHDLRIGDFVVFRQERDLGFHVTMLGASCCEIQYVSCLEEQSNLGKIQRNKEVRKNPRRETESVLEPSCFVANVSSSSLLYDRLNLPRSFARANGLDRCGEIVLMNEKGRSWTSYLRGTKSCRVNYIRGGWRSFCNASGIRAGSFFTFKLIQKGRTQVLRLSPTQSEVEEEEEEAKEKDCSEENEEEEEEDCSEENEEEEEEDCSEENEVESLSTESESYEESSQGEEISEECSKRKEKKSQSIQKASSSASQNRFVTITLTPYNINYSRLDLSMPFTKVNGIRNAKKMSLVDKYGVKWSTKLYFGKERKRMRLAGGWKEFCDANGGKIGDSFMLELIWEADGSCILKFCSKVMSKTK